MQFTTNLPAAEAHKLVPLREHRRHVAAAPQVEPAARPAAMPGRAAEPAARHLTGHAHA